MAIKYSIEVVKGIFEERGYYLEDDKYISIKSKMSFHDLNGYRYYSSFGTLLANIKANLNTCYKVSTRNKYSTENIINWLKVNNKKFKLISGNFIDSHAKNLNFKCDKCGHEWVSYWNDIQTGGRCIECYKKNRGSSKRNSIDKVLKKFDHFNLILLDPENYKNTESYLSVKCKKCGHEWSTKYGNVHNGHGCPRCHFSKGEDIIANYLKNNNINYVSQKRFVACFDIKKLPFDFYLPDYDICIEFQGGLHIEPVDYFGGEKSFHNRLRHDKIKKDFCLGNNIKLLEIFAKDMKCIDDILNKELLKGGQIL